MTRVGMHEDISKVLLTEEEIKNRINALGAQLKKDYQGKDVVVIALLKGAAYFATGLTLAMDIPVRIDFMVASSYGNSTNSCGNVSVRLDVNEKLAGRHVILVDDIIDTGLTLEAVCCMLQEHKPASIKTAVLCDKAERRVTGKSADYVGFCIPDEFVVGYGLDYAGGYRNLPYIGVLKPCVYARA